MSTRTRALTAAVALLAVTGCQAQQPDATPSASAGQPSSFAPASNAPRTSQPAAADGSFTMTLSGDLLWHDTLWKSAANDARKTGNTPYDFNPLFTYLTPVISAADLSVCHEEVPFAKLGGPYKNYPVFSVPPQTVPAIAKAGFDICSTASNHSVDAGFDGLVTTLDTLDAHKIGHFGTARTEEESTKPVIREVNGIKVGFVGGTFGTNGMPVKNAWSVDMWDPDAMLAKAKAAKEAGAEFVVVAMHGGVEYNAKPTPEQVSRAEKLAASPYVDLIYGHHAHVVQPWTKINGKYVLYGLGNLVNHGIASEPRVYEGVIARLTVARANGKITVTKAEYIPTLGTRGPGGNPPVRVYPVKQAMADKLYDAKRLAQAEERTRTTILSMGIDGITEA